MQCCFLDPDSITDRYNPSNVSILEDYLYHQIRSGEYDCLANLAILKLCVSSKYREVYSWVTLPYTDISSTRVYTTQTSSLMFWSSLWPPSPFLTSTSASLSWESDHQALPSTNPTPFHLCFRFWQNCTTSCYNVAFLLSGHCTGRTSSSRCETTILLSVPDLKTASGMSSSERSKLLSREFLSKDWART